MEFLKDLLEMLTPYLLEVITLVIAVVVVPQLKALLKQLGIKEFVQNEKELVLDTMYFVERLFKHLDGKQKWDMAKSKAVEKAKKIGLKMDEKDIDDLLDTFVEEFDFDWDES